MTREADSELSARAQELKAGPEGIRVEKYKNTRHWAVWVGDRLLAVTVYKKGALAIKETLILNGKGGVDAHCVVCDGEG